MKWLTPASVIDLGCGLGGWLADWADLFARRGFCVIDCFRYRLWEDERVDWWYRQNIMLYVRADQLDRWPDLAALRHSSPARPLPLIHPKMFQVFLDWGISQQQRYWNLYQERESASKRE